MNTFTKILGILIVIGAIVFVYIYAVPHVGDVKNSPVVTEPNNQNSTGGTTGVQIPPVNDGGNIACTMDAKMCPDGSYVGRSGPKCEFTQCPSTKLPDQKPDTGTYNVELGKSIIINGITIKPLKIKEDSRCPRDVQCVWAGRIVVTTILSSGNTTQQFDIEMGKAVSFINKKITMTSVSINGSKYMFEVK